MLFLYNFAIIIPLTFSLFSWSVFPAPLPESAQRATHSGASPNSQLLSRSTDGAVYGRVVAVAAPAAGAQHRGPPAGGSGGAGRHRAHLLQLAAGAAPGGRRGASGAARIRSLAPGRVPALSVHDAAHVTAAWSVSFGGR